MERDNFNAQQYFTRFISTHTLTWSVTSFSYIIQIQKKNFNSHAHVERDETSSFYDGENKNFNSHAHVERDARRFSKIGRMDYFNSHAHVERDVKLLETG